jgi:hypothetical protein
LLRPHLRRNRHPTFFRPRRTPPSFRLRRHLRRKPRRDKPSRSGFFGTLLFGHTTPRPSGTPLPSSTLGLWARPIPPHQQPRKQHRISFSKPPLLETPQSPQHLRPPGQTTTSDGEACLAVNPLPTAPGVSPPPSVDDNHGSELGQACSQDVLSSYVIVTKTPHGSGQPIPRYAP